MASSAGGAANGLETPVFSLHTVTEQEAELLYNRGCAAIRNDVYDEAVDSFSKALEIRTRLFGELGLECAQTYYKLGCALLYKVQGEADAVVDTKGGKGQSSAAAEGSKAHDNEDDEEDEEDEKAEGDGMVVDEETGEEEETDLELAWKVLDIARIIHAKEAERSLDEVDVIIALADISLEREHFDLCFGDYNAALVALENLVEPDNRRIAELCFKICLAKQMDQKPHEALDYCRRAISVCERRLERLQRELPTGKVSEPNKGVEVIISEVVVEEVTDGVKVTSKIVVEGVTDGVDVAQLNDSTPSLEADVKDVEDVEKPVSTENATERVTDGDVTEAKDVELSPEEELKAEVKEIEELLVDLREREEELQQMAVAPSLLDALKASNPEAAAMMTEVYSRSLGVKPFDNGVSSGISQIGSSSSAEPPVTNLGVMGRGVKRATLTPISDDQTSSDVQPSKKRTTEDVLKGGSSGETQIGFNGHS